MRATQVSRIVLGLALLIAMSATLLYEEHSRARLRTENESLRQATNQLGRLAAENARLSNLVAKSHGLQTLVNNQLRELVQLRSEGKGGRGRATEVPKPRPTSRPAPGTPPIAAGTGLTVAPVAEPAAAAALDREAWAFVGYSSPEAALQSAAWAMSNGDVNTFLASLTPEGLEYMQRQFEGKTETEVAALLQAEMNNIRALHLDRRHDVSDTKVSFPLSSGEQDITPEHLMTFKQTDAGWKLTASPDE